MRALVIEDDEQIAVVNKRVLESEGFAVELAATLSEGQRLASADHYDIIVTDLMLPDGHGLAIVESVRGRGNGTPILVLTGVDAVESTVAAQALSNRRAPGSHSSAHAPRPNGSIHSAYVRQSHHEPNCARSDSE
jgi:DNA-binding response OmpR family regulator